MDRTTITIIAAGLLAVSAGSAFAHGAIAVDDSFGEEPSGVGYGFATLYVSKQEAAQGAMDACQSEGNSECKVVLTFSSGCGAYAASRNNYGVGTGRTMEAAEKSAVTNCGEGDCVAVVSDCE